MTLMTPSIGSMQVVDDFIEAVVQNRIAEEKFLDELASFAGQANMDASSFRSQVYARIDGGDLNDTMIVSMPEWARSRFGMVPLRAEL